MDPLSIARYGMSVAQAQVASAARRISAGPVSEDAVKDIVDLTQAKQAFVANVAVIKVADEMWRALLDAQESNRR